MRWCTAVNAWGDSCVAYGNAHALMSSVFEEEFGIVHYGFDPHISAFLALQKGVGDVRHVKPENDAARRYWIGVMSTPSVPLSEYAPELLRGTGVDVEDVIRTHVYHLNYKQAVHRWHDPVLPESAMVWAKTFVQRAIENQPFILLHPYSIQSSVYDGHWPYWRQAIEWLCPIAQDFGLKILWTGAVNPLDIRHPAIINAVGLTPSMLEVFAFQRLAALTVATSNGCAHWAVMDRTPAVICCNNHMLPEHRHIFKEWIDAPPVVQVEYRDRLERFQQVICGALSEVLR